MLTPEETRQLLTQLQKSISDCVIDYEKDTKKIDEKVKVCISFVKNIAEDLSAELKKANHELSITEYNRFISRVKKIGEDAIKEGRGIFEFLNNDELINFGNFLLNKVATDFIKLKSEFEDKASIEQAKNQKTEENSGLSKQLESLSQQLSTAVTELRIAQKQLTETQTNIQQLGLVLQKVTFEVDDSTFKTIESAFEQLQLQKPKVKLITDTKPSIFYTPFQDFSEEIFSIPGLEFNPITDPSKLEKWKQDKSKNQVAYEKLKLSECLPGTTYALICKLMQLYRQNIPENTNPHAHYQPDEKLKNPIESIIKSVIENWSLPWSECVKEIITPALKQGPDKVTQCLEEVMKLPQQEKFLDNWYKSPNKKIEALCSIVCPQDAKGEYSHFLPRNQEIAKNLQTQITNTQTLPTNKIK